MWKYQRWVDFGESDSYSFKHVWKNLMFILYKELTTSYSTAESGNKKKTGWIQDNKLAK